MQNRSLKENAVLMRLSIGLPGEARQDKPLTDDVKQQHSLGAQSGKWIKALYPPEALAPVKKVDGEARSYHEQVTLPFDAGVGILPGILIPEYADRMRQFKGERECLVQSHFAAKYDEWVEWARREQNGTFDPGLYPGFDAIKGKFYFRTEPIPVPDSAHFANTVASLLGTDVDAVNVRVADAAKEAQSELLRRMIEPVAHMAKTLSKDSPRIFDTLVSNIEDIVKLAPALNLSGDPQIDAFVADMKALMAFSADQLRHGENVRTTQAIAAEAMLKKLSGYKLS